MMKISYWIVFLLFSSVVFCTDITLNQSQMQGLNMQNIFINESDCFIIQGENMTYSVKFCPTLQKININTTLDYGTTYSDQTKNISVSCKQYEGLNFSRNLSNDEILLGSQIDSRHSFIVKCEKFDYNICKQNESVNVELGNVYRNQVCNINVSAPPKVNLGINKQLAYGESYVRDDIGLSLTAPSAPKQCFGNYTETLTEAKRNFTNSEFNINIGCQFPEQQIVSASALLSGNNSTCNTSVTIKGTNLTYCPNRITDLFTAEEKLNGQFEEGITRLAETADSNYQTCTQEKQECEDKLKFYKDVDDKNKLLSDEAVQGITMLLILVMVFVALILGGIVYVITKSKEKEVER